MILLKDYLGKELYNEYLKNRNYLKNISWYSLPNKPSQKGYSADDIRRKSYEPVLQIFDWLYRVKGDVENLIDNQQKIFELHFEALVLLHNQDGIKINHIFETTITNEQLELIENYMTYRKLKDIYITIGSDYQLLHSNVTSKENEYVIRGLGFNIQNDHMGVFTIKINKETNVVNGVIEDYELTENAIRDEINKKQEELKQYCDKTFVPKTDVKRVEEMEYENDILTPITDGGYIEISTYNTED